MVVSRRAITKKGLIYRYIFAICMIFLGLFFNVYNIGNNYFFSYDSVGNYLVYVGFLIILITVLLGVKRKNKIVDERAQKIGSRAMSYVWMFIFIGGFFVMVLDGIKTINLSISQFVSYAICFILLVYFISYKIIERKS